MLAIGIPLWLIADLWSKAAIFISDYQYNLAIARGYDWQTNSFIEPAINTGSAWSLGADHPEIIALLTLVLIPLIMWFYWSAYRHQGRYYGFAFAGIIGGAFGNAYDRFMAFAQLTRAGVAYAILSLLISR